MRIALIGLATVLLVGCLPTRSGFLRIPVEVGPTHPGGPVIVVVPIADLATRLPGFDPGQAAYFFRGDQPLPHRERDRDGDGTLDQVEVGLPAAEGEDRDCWLVVVCPGPATDAPLPEGSATGVRVQLSN